MFMDLDIAKTGLKPSTIETIQSCLANFGDVELAVIYGSRAIGNYRNGSDIDLCLIGEKLKAEDLLSLETALDDLLTPYSFDVCIYSQIDNPNLVDHINRVGRVLLKKTEP